MFVEFYVRLTLLSITFLVAGWLFKDVFFR